MRPHVYYPVLAKVLTLAFGYWAMEPAPLGMEVAAHNPTRIVMRAVLLACAVVTWSFNEWLSARWSK